MEAQSSLSQEQQSVLRTTFHVLENTTIYLQSVLPVVSGPDENLLKALVELAETCLGNLPKYFVELQPLAEEWKKRGGVR